MTGTVLALLALGLALSLPLTGLLVRLGNRVGALDSPGSAGHVKVLRKVPNIGGIAIFWASFGPILAGLALLAALPDDRLGAWFPGAAPHLGHARAVMGDWIAILCGAAVLHAVGLVDDRRALPAWPKLLAQVGVALGVVLFSDIRLLHPADATGFGPEAFSVALTTAWIVVVVNAVNFMDNMDGLAGGTALIGALCFLVATMLNGQWFIASALALLAGSLAGFLAWNLPPARIFMGDGGSLYIGFMLATLAARTTFVDSADPSFALGTAWYGIFMPLLVLAVPLYDGVYTTIWRIRRGKSPFVGGHEHLSHRLVALGLSPRRAVAVMWMLTAVTAVSGIGLGLMRPWQAALVGVQLVGIFVLLAVLEASVERPSGGAK